MPLPTRMLWVSAVCAVLLSCVSGAALADTENPPWGSSATTPSPTAMIPPAFTTLEMSSRDELAISVSPTSGPPGTVVTVRGAGWTHQTYADGVPIEISQNYGNGQLSRLTSGKSGPPDANGAFSLRMTIPRSAKPGLLSISPITGGPETEDALFTVTGISAPSGQNSTTASVTLTASDGPPGTVTTADGRGFTPNQPVKVTQSGGSGVTGGGGTVQADQSGAIYMSFRIADQTPPGVITVTFRQSVNVATAQFRVTSRAPAPGQASGDQLGQVAQATGLAWQIIDTLNTVCSIDHCQYIPSDISQVISKINKTLSIGNLTYAAGMGVVVGNDLAELNKSLKGHVKGTPYSAEVLALKRKTGNDTRKLHGALTSAVPGLSLVFPVPPPF